MQDVEQCLSNAGAWLRIFLDNMGSSTCIPVFPPKKSAFVWPPQEDIYLVVRRQRGGLYCLDPQGAKASRWKVGHMITRRPSEVYGADLDHALLRVP